MATTFSNPKEMLGYKIIQDMQGAPDILKSAPYDRKAAWAYYYTLRHIHSQMISFQSDMFVLDIDEETKELTRYPHNVAYPVIMNEIKSNWATVYSNQQDLLLEALFKFSELIASSFPKLGLVPESGESIHEEERILDVAKEEQEVITDEPIQEEPESTADTDIAQPLSRAEMEQIARTGRLESGWDEKLSKAGPIVSDSVQPKPRKPTGYRFS